MKYWSFEAHPNSSINSCVQFNNTYLLTGGGNDFNLKLHDLENGKANSPIRFPKYHTNSINALDISQTCDFIVSASNDVIIVIDVIRRTKLFQIFNSPMVESNPPAQQLENNHAKHQVLDCKLMNDSLIATCGVNHHLNLSDLRQHNLHRPVYSINLGNDNLNCLDFNKVNYDISVGSSNGNLYTVDIRNSSLMIDGFDYKDSAIMNVSKYETNDWNLINFDNGMIEISNKDKSKSANFKMMLSASASTTTNNASISYKLNSQYIPTTNHIINGTKLGIVEIWNFNPLTSKIARSKQLSIPPPKSSSAEKDAGNSAAATLLNYIHYNESTNQLVSASGNGFIHVWDYLL